MFRNYFMPGIAVVLLGLFSFSRQPAAPQVAGPGPAQFAIQTAKETEPARDRRRHKEITNAGNKPPGYRSLGDKTLLDREEVGALAIYEIKLQRREAITRSQSEGCSQRRRRCASILERSRRFFRGIDSFRHYS